MFVIDGAGAIVLLVPLQHRALQLSSSSACLVHRHVAGTAYLNAETRVLALVLSLCTRAC